MSSQERVEVLEQEIAQLRAEAQGRAAAEEYLKNQLAEALRAVELAKKQLMLLEMQQVEIQSLRNQVTNFKAQLAFAQDREAQPQPVPQMKPEQPVVVPEVAPPVIAPALRRERSGPSLPSFLRRQPEGGPVTN